MRRRILIAAIALAVILAPAVLVTVLGQRGRASFGDREIVGENRLTSARVSIGVGDLTVPIPGRNMAPGDSVIGAIELENDGTVPLRYAMTATTVDSELARWMEWRFGWITDGGRCTADTPRPFLMLADGGSFGGAVFGNPAPGRQPGDRRLEVGDVETLCIEVTLLFEAPNAVQSMRFDQRFTFHAEQAVDDDAAHLNTGEGLD